METLFNEMMELKKRMSSQELLIQELSSSVQNEGLKLTTEQLEEFKKDCFNAHNYMNQTMLEFETITRKIYQYHAKN